MSTAHRLDFDVTDIFEHVIALRLSYIALPATNRLKACYGGVITHRPSPDMKRDIQDVVESARRIFEEGAECSLLPHGVTRLIIAATVNYSRAHARWLRKEYSPSYEQLVAYYREQEA